MEIFQACLVPPKWKILAIHFLLNKQWLCNISEYQWIPGSEPKATLSGTESAVTGATLVTYCMGVVENSVAATALITMAEA